ncbi:MAG TPA: hypothetical protein VNZ52_00680, partial [Candidatus Thermoplasmatota archaeon]|nr:hypothetical protein [Candidatus Thermoplasmatota archaeon]
PLYPQDFVWAPGHRIGLILKPSDPVWVRSAGAGATGTVSYGLGGSALNLPVVTPSPTDFWLTSWGKNQVPYLGQVEGGSA